MLLEQAAAAEGSDAVALIAEARSALLQIEQDCAAAGVVALDQTYTAPENVFTLDYPHDWTVGTYTPSSTGGIVFIGNSPLADRLLQVAEPQIEAGEQGSTGAGRRAADRRGRHAPARARGLRAVGRVTVSRRHSD